MILLRVYTNPYSPNMYLILSTPWASMKVRSTVSLSVALVPLLKPVLMGLKGVDDGLEELLKEHGK